MWPGSFKNNNVPNPVAPSQIYAIGEGGEIVGLRQNKEVYLQFVKTCGQAVYGRTFNIQGQTTPLSRFFPTALEAFLVLAYDNGYEVWKKTAQEELGK